MEPGTMLSVRQEQQEKSLLIFVVVVGYIVTFTMASNGSIRYSVAQLLMGILFGAIYLILGFFETDLLQHFPINKRNVLFFSIEIALVLGIGWTLGPWGSWLIGLPLSAMAVERLTARSRWFVNGALLLAIVLPILHYSTWETTMANGFVIAVAIFFVDLFSQFRLSERLARERAEGLMLQLEAANHRLAEYASQAEELAAARERNRLAREIHDSLGHYLTVVNVQIEAAKVTLGTDPGRSLDSLNKAHEVVRKGLASVRESVIALRASPIENRTLWDAIAALIGETQAFGINVQFRVRGTPRVLDENVALAFYRVVQEGLTNIRKHAHAAHADVELDFSQLDSMRLRVQDDGVGTEETGGGFGLIGIRERIRLLGGECHIESQPGQGFCLEVVVPILEQVGV